MYLEYIEHCALLSSIHPQFAEVRVDSLAANPETLIHSRNAICTELNPIVVVQGRM